MTLNQDDYMNDNSASQPAPPAAPPPARLAIPSHRAIVTWLIISANVIVWLLMEMNGGSDNTDTLIAFGAKVNELINQGEVWRLFTAMFLHIGIIHLAVNQYSLYNVGTVLERFFGSIRFSILYVLAGLCGSLASYWFSPNSISAGASGAIFGLVGALGVFFLLHRKLFGSTANRILVNIAAIAAFNLVLGASIAGIDNMAHVGGLLGGIAVGATLSPRYELTRDLSGVPQIRRRDTLLTWFLVLGFGGALALTTAYAMQANQDSAQTHLTQGEKLYEAHQFGAAIVELQTAMARDPQRPEVYFYLGLAYFDQEHYGDAARAFENTLTLKPDWAAAHYNLALSYANVGRYADARAALQQYVSLPDANRAKAADLLQQIQNR